MPEHMTACECTPNRHDVLRELMARVSPRLVPYMDVGLATARKRNLGLVMATQYIERLKPAIQDAVMANARTKIIFNSSAKSAHVHWQDFASMHVKHQDFMNLKAFEALARVNTETGVSDPITLKTYDAPDGYERGAEILAMSSRRYGRDKKQIDADDASRRIVEPPEPPHKKNVGRY